MKSSQPVPQEVVQQVAEYFSILSEPMRLRILNLLRDGEKCVQELVEATQTSQANVSKHLKLMLQAGILTRRTEGTSASTTLAVKSKSTKVQLASEPRSSKNAFKDLMLLI